jgi:peptide/nickel transport system substrate-binding protein
VIANRDTLTIRLTRPSATLSTRLAMPYFSAVPPDTPIDPAGIKGIPSAGPYYLAAADHTGGLVLRRNPNYGGERPHRLREIQLGPRPPQPQAIAQVQAGESDALTLTPEDGGAAARLRLQARYGPGSAAARAGQQRYFSAPTPSLHYLALNTQRPLFSNARLRRAVNYAIDRPALAAEIHPPAFGRPTDQYIPPVMPGFADAKIYPLGGPDIATARRLAGHRHRHAVLYTCELPACQHNAAVVRQNLRSIGIDVEIRRFSYDALDRRLRRPGEPWDITDIGWIADYADPAAITQPIFDQVGRAPIPINSINVGRFANPRLQRRMHAVDRLTGARRYRAYARLDADLARQAAPVAAYATDTTDYIFSARIGCQTMHPVYGLDLAALCARP